MKIAIAGGTGFVGKALTAELVEKRHEVVILTRREIKANKSEGIRYVQWLSSKADPIHALQGTDIFINLAGESINSGRWTDKRKQRILDSRIGAVREILAIIKKMDIKPTALINASAIGIYGISAEKVFTEEDKSSGNDFLSQTVMEWEKEAVNASQLDIRTALCRFGIILAKQEGALPKIAFPYKSFIGGPIGAGQQWMSWIHIDDVIKGISFIIENKNIHGPVNFTAPHPVTMAEFGQTLAEVIHRPHWLTVPSFAFRLLLGEMSTLVVDGQKVLPNKLLENGYPFQYPELKLALKNIFN
jgi:hypothetical protein